MARYSSGPLGPPIRPPAWCAWYRQYSPLVPRKYDDERNALVICGTSAIQYFSPNYYLPANLSLECAVIERFIDLSYLERIGPNTQLAIFDGCDLKELSKASNKIRDLLKRVALIFYVPRPSPDYSAREAIARIGLADPGMVPFYCISDSDLAPEPPRAAPVSRSVLLPQEVAASAGFKLILRLQREQRDALIDSRLGPLAKRMKKDIEPSSS